MTIDWKNLFKVRIASSDPSMTKHEVAKLILVMKLLYKHRKRKDWIRIYTEFQLDNGCKPDVYFEDIKTKEAIAYEIQKVYTNDWLKRKTNEYNEWKPPFFNSADVIPIDLNTLSEDINKMDKELEKYVF